MLTNILINRSCKLDVDSHSRWMQFLVKKWGFGQFGQDNLGCQPLKALHYCTSLHQSSLWNDWNQSRKACCQRPMPSSLRPALDCWLPNPPCSPLLLPVDLSWSPILLSSALQISSTVDSQALRLKPEASILNLLDYWHLWMKFTGFCQTKFGTISLSLLWSTRWL